jgi:preprotein translocase SecE subunit
MRRLRNELKSIKWLKSDDVMKQTLLVTSVTVLSGAILLGLDTLVQYIIGIIV